MRIVVTETQVGQTIAALLRAAVPGKSWTQVRELVAKRRVNLNGELWLDPARRVKPGDVVELSEQSQKLPEAFAGALVIRYLDEHVVVVEKPAGLVTTRHPEEREWDQWRRARSPTLDDRLRKVIAERLNAKLRGVPQPRKVHRLDKLTSGLLVFARSPLAERELGKQFYAHTVARRYIAFVLGRPAVRTIETWIVPDRGDGRRGSSGVPGKGKRAVTHLESVEPVNDVISKVVCRLETGRTHQIRIHLAEQGCLVCGDPVYVHRPDGSEFQDISKAPRLALHATELGFRHPVTGAELHWTMPLPNDLQTWVDGLK